MSEVLHNSENPSDNSTKEDRFQAFDQDAAKKAVQERAKELANKAMDDRTGEDRYDLNTALDKADEGINMETYPQLDGESDGQYVERLEAMRDKTNELNGIPTREWTEKEKRRQIAKVKEARGENVKYDEKGNYEFDEDGN